MMRALWTAGTGMAAQQANMDVISNNLANVNTTGFKKSRTDFADLMYQTLRQPGASSGPDTQVPSGIQMGHGVRQVATQKIFTQGSYQSTGNSLDMLIEGDGFFQVTMPDGTISYTRDGSFKKDSQGRIVTSDGYPLEPQITIPDNATELSVSSDGIITVAIPGQTAPQELGQLQIVRFINPAGLSSIGRNLYQETAASGTPTAGNPGDDGAGTITQKYLEMSNVQVVEEMVNMIVAQRAYEINSKAIQTSDEMLGQVAGLKR
ncbi:MAG TPA: flagellar basal-body rod protein FlgG [Methylomusa anaerophila]|uniref:Flagellar basal-body rod protein FlgG n=1 Tax=Methylomusa anaerophila TaxID=1930071 RepID=A0A348AKE0_9FIRM|nr:flagellar basal-body rod protein FlgG [Methylomusa anaerophila]BBB91538.1 flagellar basal-body rod protein FlgG [Methylomusa anaerophila]HML89524.1 flagellar basal-body rod protein FlgG [Methylomusa anaerophila]